MLAMEIACRLLILVYHPVSAVVEVDEKGQVRCVQIFDTDFGDLLEERLPEAGEVWLMSNHPEGSSRLSEADVLNVMRIKSASPSVRLRVFVTNEDFICREIVI